MSVPNRISIALCMYSKNNRNAIKYMYKEVGGGGVGYHTENEVWVSRRQQNLKGHYRRLNWLVDFLLAL